MTIRATRGVTHNDSPARQQAVAGDALLAVVLPSVFDLDRDTSKDQRRVCDKSSPRSASGLARLTGSNVIRIGCCIYNNLEEQAMSQTTAPLETYRWRSPAADRGAEGS